MAGNDALKRFADKMSRRTPGEVSVTWFGESPVLVDRAGAPVAHFDFQYADDCEAVALALNTTDAFQALAESVDAWAHLPFEQRLKVGNGPGSAAHLVAALDALKGAVAAALRAEA